MIPPTLSFHAPTRAWTTRPVHNEVPRQGEVIQAFDTSGVRTDYEVVKITYRWALGADPRCFDIGIELKEVDPR